MRRKAVYIFESDSEPGVKRIVMRLPNGQWVCTCPARTPYCAEIRSVLCRHKRRLCERQIDRMLKDYAKVNLFVRHLNKWFETLNTNQNLGGF